MGGAGLESNRVCVGGAGLESKYRVCIGVDWNPSLGFV